MGIFLITSALLVLIGKIYGRFLIIAAWGFNSGLLYGSFFSKITDNKYNFQSNIEPSLLIILIGLGFITATLSLLWVLIIQKKSIKIGSTELKEIK